VAYTTADLLEKIRLQAFLPETSDFTDARLLSLANDHLITVVADRIKASREDYWLTFEDIRVTGATTYRLPRRSLARIVRDVKLINTAGVVLDFDNIDPPSGWVGIGPSTTSYCYYFKDDFIVFPGTPPAGYTMRVWYLRQPSKLVLTSAAMQIDHAGSTTSIELAGPVPETMQTAGTLLDVVYGETPYDLTYTDLRVASWDSGDPNVITLDPSTPVDPAVISTVVGNPNGRQDWICLRDQTVSPQIPEELFTTLEGLVVEQVLRMSKDLDGAAAAGAGVLRSMKAAQDLIEPRNEAGSRPIISRFSPLRGAGAGRRRWR